MRKPIIAGNWKMNNTAKETKELLSALRPLVSDASCDIVVCVPFTDLIEARKAIRGSNIKLGAQNAHWAEKGAFTGEVSCAMLKELHVQYVIIGHSERRQYFGETDATVNKRVAAVVASKMTAIVCVGETLEQREAGETESVLYRQIVDGLKGFKKRAFSRIVVAYEPVWAIGTGKTASNEDANDTIAYIRSVVAKKFGQEIADGLRIQYGGSMNAKNADGLMEMPEIDGGLIGGASLKAEDFSVVVHAAK